MAHMMVPSLAPGQRSLPASLRTRPGMNFAQRRLGMGISGLFGLGQTCEAYDSDGNCLAYDDGSTGTQSIPTQGPGLITPVATPDSTTAATDYTCSSVPLSSMTAAQMSNCGYVVSTGGYSVPSSLGIPASAGATLALSPTAATPAAPSGMQWATLISASGTALAKVLTVAQGGSSVTLPNGSVLDYSAGAVASGALASVSSLLSNPTTLLLIGGVLLFIMMEKK
jgi:hypothetical protein